MKMKRLMWPADQRAEAGKACALTNGQNVYFQKIVKALRSIYIFQVRDH